MNNLRTLTAIATAGLQKKENRFVGGSLDRDAQRRSAPSRPLTGARGLLPAARRLRSLIGSFGGYLADDDLAGNA
jgi:hypothetical protein